MVLLVDPHGAVKNILMEWCFFLTLEVVSYPVIHNLNRSVSNVSPIFFFHRHQDTCKPFSSEKNYNLVIVFFVPKSTLTRAFKMRLSVNNAVIYRKKPHMVFGKWKRGVGCLFLLKKKWREVFSITYGARALLSHLFK